MFVSFPMVKKAKCCKTFIYLFILLFTLLWLACFCSVCCPLQVLFQNLIQLITLFASLLRFQESPVQWAQAVVFAVEEINRNSFLLPGIRLGYRIVDTCTRYPYSLRAGMSMISGGNGTCETTRPAKILIGDSGSTQSIIMSRVLTPLHVPLVSFMVSKTRMQNE